MRPTPITVDHIAPDTTEAEKAVLRRHYVKVSGHGSRAMVFAHGFGCDQNMWRLVAPAFEHRFRVVVFDHVGHGRSDLSAWDRRKYASLSGYADDVRAICAALRLQRPVFVGHSVSAMIGAIAAIAEPELFDCLLMLSPSPCYIDDGDYEGGFSREDLDGLLDALDGNYLGWSHSMAPVIVGNQDRPELGAELAHSFCRTDPEVARQFARTTFLSDNRGDLARLTTPSLILQCADDVIAPAAVGEYMHRMLPHSELVMMRATGHCPNLSAADETIAAMCTFLDARDGAATPAANRR